MTQEQYENEIRSLAITASGVFHAIGRVIIRMLGEGLTKAEAVTIVKRGVPNPKATFAGRVITLALINDLVMIAEALDGDQIVSPDGLHSVSTEGLRKLDLTPNQLARLSDGLTKGQVSVKKMSKYISAIDRKPENATTVMPKVLDLIATDEEREAARAEGNTIEGLKLKVSKQVEKIAKAEARLAEEKASLRHMQRRLREMEMEAEENTTEAATEAPKVRSTRPAAAQRAAVAVS